MKVTTFGFAGSGKGTAGPLIAEKFGLEFISSGNIFRQMAADRGITIVQLDEESKHDKGVADRRLDEMIAEIGRTRDNFLVESRLAWHFIPDSIKILLKCDDRVRYERVARRENIPVARAADESRIRDTSIIERARAYYGLESFWLDHNFHIVIDTSTATVENIVKSAVEKICRHAGSSAALRVSAMV